MPVPLLHFVGGHACDVVPVKPYASICADAGKAGGLCQSGLSGYAAVRWGRGGTFGVGLPDCAASAAAVVVLGRNGGRRVGGLLRLRGVVGGNQRVAQRK